jgi:hypothetical protein
MKLFTRLFDFSKKHTEGIDVNALLEQTKLMKTTFSDRMDYFKILCGQNIDNFDTRIKTILDNRRIPIRMSKDILEEGQMNTKTEWDLYNRYTYRLSHIFHGNYDRYNQIHDTICTEFGVD